MFVSNWTLTGSGHQRRVDGVVVCEGTEFQFPVQIHGSPGRAHLGSSGGRRRVVLFDGVEALLAHFQLAGQSGNDEEGAQHVVDAHNTAQPHRHERGYGGHGGRQPASETCTTWGYTGQHGAVVRAFVLYWGGIRFECLWTHHCWAFSKSFIPSLMVLSITKNNAFGREKQKQKEQRWAVRPLWPWASHFEKSPPLLDYLAANMVP